jgi:hypothetical protein
MTWLGGQPWDPPALAPADHVVVLVLRQRDVGVAAFQVSPSEGPAATFVHVRDGWFAGVANNRGHVVGVASSANFAGNSNYDQTYVAYSWIFNTAAILQTTGVINLLRVHDVKTGFGPLADPVTGEVIVGFGNRPNEWFGFELRTGSREPMAAGMFALLRDSFIHEDLSE